MADILSELYNSCDPNRSSTSEQYVDLSSVRGNKAFSNAIIRVLNRTNDLNNSSQTYVRALFAGHIGSGKSSELQHLQEIIRANAGATSRFLPIVMDGVAFLDFYNADVEDVLVTLEQSTDQRVDNTDPDIGDMLRQTWIMEYVNGSDDGDVTPWYAHDRNLNGLGLNKIATQPSAAAASV